MVHKGKWRSEYCWRLFGFLFLFIWLFCRLISGREKRGSKVNKSDFFFPMCKGTSLLFFIIQHNIIFIHSICWNWITLRKFRIAQTCLHDLGAERWRYKFCWLRNDEYFEQYNNNIVTSGKTQQNQLQSLWAKYPQR